MRTVKEWLVWFGIVGLHCTLLYPVSLLSGWSSQKSKYQYRDQWATRYYVVGLVHCSAVVLWGELDYRVWVLWGELVEEEVKTGGRMVAQWPGIPETHVTKFYSWLFGLFISFLSSSENDTLIDYFSRYSWESLNGPSCFICGEYVLLTLKDHKKYVEPVNGSREVLPLKVKVENWCYFNISYSSPPTAAALSLLLFLRPWYWKLHIIAGWLGPCG